MSDYVRMIAIGGTIGALVAGTLGLPGLIGAIAEEPKQAVVSTIEELFAPPFDPEVFKRYAITLGESVSTEVKSTSVVKKIAFGRTTSVSISTTASGTYSSDALLSPNVRYPGIEVTPKHGRSGSFWYSSSTSPRGTGSWMSFSSGSITYYTYSFKPAART
jgi:hypothetical protein